MKAHEIAKGIYWVGAIDWDLRNFHGYRTQRGTTYNAYLIVDEKIVLIDAVKEPFCHEMIERIRTVLDPSEIDVVISQHAEMDHSGSIPALMEILEPETPIYTSPQGEKGLRAHFKKEWNFKPMQAGEEISIGKQTLQFFPIPMVHWPDNMMTYLKEEKILFSNDAFGQHLASSERFDNEYPLDIIFEEAKKYYANIVLPYDAQTQKAMEYARKAGKIEMIAPAHGIIWKNHITEILGEYKKWCHNETEKKAVVVYDTMWHSTEKMAQAIESVLDEMGIPVFMANLHFNHISDIMTKVQESRFIFVGSPTLNNQMMPNVAAFLTYLKGLKPRNRKGMAFGSFGWGGQSIGYVDKELQETGIETLESLRSQYIPDVNELKKTLRERLKSL